LLIGAIIVIGLALFLMYVNPASDQAKKSDNSSKITTQPKTDSSKDDKNLNQNQNQNNQSSQPEVSNTKSNGTNEINPSKEYSQQIAIEKIESFPANKMIAAGGRVAFTVSVKNETSNELVGQNVALLLDGEPYQRRSVDIPVNEIRTVAFAIEGLAKGNHEIQINSEKMSVTALDLSSAPKRDNANIPTDPKLVSAAQGLTSLGLPGGNLLIAIANGLTTLNPVVAFDNETLAITRQINGYLIELNPLTGVPEPALASSWQYSADNLELKINLRQGVRFSDGKEFTADDVVFTFSEVLFNSDINAREREGLRVGGSLISVEKLDTYIVRFTLAKPFRPLLYTLASVAILPKHKLSEKIAKLQPGARGYWNGAKALLERNRDALTVVSKESLTGLNEKLIALELAIAKKEVQSIEKEVREAIQRSEALLGVVSDSYLKVALERFKDYLTRTIDTSQRGEFEGVSPLLFDQSWSVTEAREHPENIVGLGPFVFKSYDPQRRIVLERNLSYWKLDEKGLQLPYLNRLIYDVQPSSDTSLKRFQDGHLDILEPQASDWSSLQATAEAKKWKLLGDAISEKDPDGFNFLPADPVEFLALNFDSENIELQKLFRDVRFRKALFNALDRKQIAENAYHKLAIEYGFAMQLSSTDLLNFSTATRDLNKAKALLDEAGWKDTNNDGLREDGSGKSIRFSLLVNSENASRIKATQLISEQLKEIGIAVQVIHSDFQTLVTQLLSGQFEAVLTGFDRAPEFYFTTSYRSSQGQLHFWHRSEPFDWEKKIDQLMEEYGYAPFSQLARLAQTIRIAEFENVPVFYLVIPNYLVVFNQSLANAENMTQLSTINRMTDILWWRDDNRRFQP
jgi:ABC-type transport system substrate-binding protein